MMLVLFNVLIHAAIFPASGHVGAVTVVGAQGMPDFGLNRIEPGKKDVNRDEIGPAIDVLLRVLANSGQGKRISGIFGLPKISHWPFMHHVACSDMKAVGIHQRKILMRDMAELVQADKLQSMPSE